MSGMYRLRSEVTGTFARQIAELCAKMENRVFCISLAAGYMNKSFYRFLTESSY